MPIQRAYAVSYQLRGHEHEGNMHIEVHTDPTGTVQYRGVIGDSPLAGTEGGYAGSVDLALDFLNLAMQAEGADAIRFVPREEG